VFAPDERRDDCPGCDGWSLDAFNARTDRMMVFTSSSAPDNERGRQRRALPRD